MSSAMMTGLAVPGLTNADIFTRALAINAALGVTVVATAAGVYGIVTYETPGAKRRAFMAAIAAAPELSASMVLSLLDSKDPASMVRQKLMEPDLDPALSLALRKALMKLL